MSNPIINFLAGGGIFFWVVMLAYIAKSVWESLSANRLKEKVRRLEDELNRERALNAKLKVDQSWDECWDDIVEIHKKYGE